jgi:hypothetical protein
VLEYRHVGLDLAQRVRFVAKHEIPFLGTIGPNARKYQDKNDQI